MNQEKNNTSLGYRLRQERERLGLTQDEVGELGGVARRTVTAWERGDQSPNAAFLATAAAHGMDVLYVLTGERAVKGPKATADDDVADAAPFDGEALLQAWSQLDGAGKAALQAVAQLGLRNAGAGPSAKLKSRTTRIHVGGDVGQSFEGNTTISAPFTITMGKKR